MADEVQEIFQEPRFSIGRVLGDSFDTMFRTFPLLLAITAIIAVPLLVWLVLGGEPLLVKFAATARIEVSTRDFDPVMAVLILLIGLVGLEIHAAVSAAAFRHLLGEAGDLLDNLRRAVLAAPSLIAAGLFVFVVFMLALFMLALASGLLSSVIHWSFGAILFFSGMAGLAVIMVRWWVVVPVIVIEQSGPIASFGRSSGLTEGNRWKIFALILIAYIPQVLVKVLLLLATPALGAPFIAVLNIVISGLFIAFNAVMAVMIYGHLRAIKEGSSTAELAEVFE
jgi:hypothetical protein